VTTSKRLKVDPSGNGKTEMKAVKSESGVSSEHTLKKLLRPEASNVQKNTDHPAATPKSLKRTTAEMDSEASKPVTSMKKTRKTESSSSGMTNGAKVLRKTNGVNGVHHTRADSPHSPYDLTDSDSSPPLELSMRQRVDLAAQFKRYYEKYEKLHRELSTATTLDTEKRDELWRMHDKLAEMKEQIKSGQMG
jgi:RNA polymerase II elongation factor ELL